MELRLRLEGHSGGIEGHSSYVILYRVDEVLQCREPVCKIALFLLKRTSSARYLASMGRFCEKITCQEQDS